MTIAPVTVPLSIKRRDGSTTVSVPTLMVFTGTRKSLAQYTLHGMTGVP